VFEGDDGVVPIRVKALLEESEPSEDEHQRVLELARTEIARRERDEYDALEETVPDHSTRTLRTARVVAAEAGDPRIPEPQICPQAATGTGGGSINQSITWRIEYCQAAEFGALVRAKAAVHLSLKSRDELVAMQEAGGT
jgi:hypothetical protein